MFRVRGRFAAALTTIAIVIGSLTFAEFAYWRDSPDASILAPPSYVATLAQLPLATGQRTYSYSSDPSSTLRANLPSMWGLPDVSGYTPLQYAGVQTFLRLAPNGQILDIASPAVDLAAIRYVVVPSEAPTIVSSQLPFRAGQLGIFLSNAFKEAPRTVELGDPRRPIADHIAIVSALGESMDVGQGTIVANVDVRYSDGTKKEIPVRAGIDTAELAYDRPGIAATTHHARAHEYSHESVVNWYDTSLAFGRRASIRSVSIRVTDPKAALNVRAVSLVDSVSKRAYPFDEESVLFADPTHFRHVTDVSTVAIFENQRARPRAWVENASSHDQPLLPVTIEGLGPERREFLATCADDCRLVSSDLNNGDWNVAVDGVRARMMTAHHILAAVALKRGKHDVVFVYRPKALIAGSKISAGAAIVLVFWLTVPIFRRHFAAVTVLRQRRHRQRT